MKTTPLTASELLQAGHWFLRKNRLYEICVWDRNNPLQVHARVATTGEQQIFTLAELFAADPPTRFAANATELTVGEKGEGPAKMVLDAATLPTPLLQKADHIIHTVEAIETGVTRILREEKNVTKTDALQQMCQALPVPVALTTYYNYRPLYEAYQGDRTQIAQALHRRSYGKTRMDANTMHFVDTIIQQFYRSNPPLRKETVYRIAQQLWHHNHHWWLNVTTSGTDGFNELIEQLLDGRTKVDEILASPSYRIHLIQIQLPSRTWFYNYVRWFDSQPGSGAEIYQTRHGQAAWEANFRVFDRFVETATLPLQYVFADHYKLDVLHVDDEYRDILSRLWLTLLVDAYSRAVLGFFLSYEDPCIESIQGALRHAVWPKTEMDQFGVRHGWTCFGIPHRLFLDNAWAHHSHSLEELARALAGSQYTAMEIVFRPPYQARYGGLIERLFGNLATQLRERLPGAILQPNQRHWHNASQGACLLYRDVERIIYQLITDYLHTPHRELTGLTPHEKWLAGLQLMIPVPPPLTPQLARCFWRLHPQSRTIRRSGIYFFGLHYWDDNLTPLRGRDRQGKQRHFFLRYDPIDVSHVAIFENGQWVGDGYARELRLADGQHEAVSLWELQMAKALVRQQNQGRLPRPQSWLIHLLETRELITLRQAEKKRIRRKVEELKTRRRGRPAITQDSAPDVVRKSLPEILKQSLEDVRSQVLIALEGEL